MLHPREESSSVAATPPWTEPIGLYIHSAGSMAKITRPGSTRVISNPSSSAIGGGGSSPAAIARIASMPGRSPAARAVMSGSDHVNVRVRCMMKLILGRRGARAAGALLRRQRERQREGEAGDRQRRDGPHHGLQPGVVGERAEQRGGDPADADRE